MNELERIVGEAARLVTVRSPFLLATVVRVAGSSYRRPGARMLVAGERWLAGCVSGGCLEGDVLLKGAFRCRDGPVVVTYDSTTEDGEAWSVGLGCNGIVDVLLEHVPAGEPSDALVFARECFAAETVGRLVTVIRSNNPAAPVGARAAVGPAVALSRPVRDAAVRDAMLRAARGPAGVIDLTDTSVTVLVEVIAPSPQLFVLGSGHDAAPLVTLAKSVGFRVTVADRAIRERSRFLAADQMITTGGDMARLGVLIDAAAEAYVVIMHHHTGADREALAMALASRARYIGILGPARRTRNLFAELGVAPDADRRVHAPIGLDLGAETPEQIALAVVGELQAVSHQARGGHLRDRARGVHADVALVVLAAGGSKRLGSPKQLVEFEGQPLVARVAGTCLAARSGPVAVVLGARGEDVGRALGDLPVAHVRNEQWADGVATSIHAAVKWAERTDAGALLITLVDQPLLNVEHLAALRDAWLAGAAIAASRFDDVAGAPALFDRSRWPALLDLSGDQGAARIVRGSDAVTIEWPGGAVDIDVPADLPKV